MTYEEYMRAFDAEKVKNDLIDWIKAWFSENGEDCCAVIGVSGGKDSTVAAGLCKEALGKDGVVGVLLPNGEQKDIDDAKRVCDFLGIKYMEINIEEAVDAVKSAFVMGFCDAAYRYYGLDLSWSGVDLISEQTEINLPPRIRMSTLYAIAQSLGGRVVNTCNLSEEAVGYSTRWGDSVGDFAPLANLTTDEIVSVGKALGLPADLVEKTPIDGLCGKTDEENLGVSYREINEYLRVGKRPSAKLSRLIERSAFKRQPISAFPYGSSPITNSNVKND